MAELKIDTLETVGRYAAGERLYLDETGSELVREGDGRAATLFAIEGDEISRDDAVKYGLVKPTAAEKKAAAAAEAEE